MKNRNYHKEMLQQVSQWETKGQIPRLLLHCCCGPCTTVVLERMPKQIVFSLFFHNPNIMPYEEYQRRRTTLKDLLAADGRQVDWLEGAYDNEQFLSLVRGLENEPEGGKRCTQCIALRLQQTAECALSYGYEGMGTTLTTGPRKNPETINRLGKKIAEEHGLLWLVSDWKKRGGYQRSIEISNQRGLYRQSDCGCIFSKHDFFHL